MKRNFLITAVACLAVLPLVAMAQPRGGGGGFGGPGGPGGRGPGGMADRLANALELTDAQKAELDQIVADHMAEYAPTEEEMEAFRSGREQMRDARQSGDEEKIAELEARFAEFRTARQAARQALFDQIETILTDAQKEEFAGIQQRMSEQRQNGRRGRGGPNFDRIAAALPEQLNMTDTQLGEFNSLIDAYKERMADPNETSGRRGRWGRWGLMREFREDLAGMLTDEQNATLDEMIAERMGQRGEGGPGGGFGEGQRGRGQQERGMGNILAALRQINLTADQREEVLAAMGKVRQEARQAPRGDREGRRALYEQMRTEVLALLTPEQAEQFKTLVDKPAGRERPERGERERNRRDRGQRGPGAPVDEESSV